MIRDNIVDKAIHMEDELDYEFIETMVKPFKKDSSLIVIDDGIQKISKSLSKLFLEGKKKYKIF